MTNSSPSSLIARFAYLGRLWACFLIFFVIPFDLVFRLDSFLLSMSWLDIAVNTAALVLIMAAIAFLAAVISTPLSLLSARFFSWAASRINSPRAGRAALLTAGLTHYLLLFYACCIFTRLSKLFALRLGLEINVGTLYIAAGLCLLILFRAGREFHEGAEGLVRVLSRPLILPLACAIALCITALHIGAELVRENRAGAGTPRPASVNAKGKPNVILITLDALSAEDMSWHGYRLPTTPNLDAFAKECFGFDNAISSANWTRPSVASLLTGKYPSTHKMFNSTGWSRTATSQDSLPACLQNEGYRTYALVSNWSYAHPCTNGTSQYFDEKPFVGVDLGEVPYYDRAGLYNVPYSFWVQSRFNISATVWLGEIYSGLSAKLEPLFPMTKPLYPPKMIFDLAQGVLDARGKEGPFFLWVHSLPPHSPYISPPPFNGHFLPTPDLQDSASQMKYFGFYPPAQQPLVDRIRLRYDENLLYADAAFGDFIKFLRDSGRLNDSIVIVSADHGESFSHGFLTHGGPKLYQQMVHIPLLIHLPGQQAGQRFAATVSQTDIAPTVLALAGLATPATMEGRSLKPALEGKALPPRPIFTMNLDGNRVGGAITKGSVAAYDEGYKYVRYLGANREELFNLRLDRHEAHDVAGAEKQRLRKLSDLVERELGIRRR